MGACRFGVPEKLALFLKDRFDLRLFVETGTFRGDTSAWASRHFEHVITIEKSPTLWEEARRRHQHLGNVEFLHGSSPQVLAGLRERLARPALMWLDAHWCGGNSYGKDDECPLLSELDVLLNARTGHAVLVDDARLFLAPPPRPHRIEQWPSIGDVLQVMEQRYGYWAAIVDDVILAVPGRDRAAVAGHLQACASDQIASSGAEQRPAKTLAALWRSAFSRSRL